MHCSTSGRPGSSFLPSARRDLEAAANRLYVVQLCRVVASKGPRADLLNLQQTVKYDFCLIPLLVQILST